MPQLTKAEVERMNAQQKAEHEMVIRTQRKLSLEERIQQIRRSLGNSPEPIYFSATGERNPLPKHFRKKPSKPN